MLGLDQNVLLFFIMKVIRTQLMSISLYFILFQQSNQQSLLQLTQQFLYFNDDEQLLIQKEKIILKNSFDDCRQSCSYIIIKEVKIMQILYFKQTKNTQLNIKFILILEHLTF
ncbi:unnamed protein product [Paramecium sonneborni]|uniref:Uncharacterized protein n=1 Tax=Paramecium sonneborni TaxID=65129 RepID=A0A8S1LE19_9CILI|nr:unnamed protein product [Paramecium sonneborni]